MTRSLLQRAVAWLAVFGWAGVIFFLSSQPELPYPKKMTAEVLSILGHFSAYSILAGLLYLAQTTSGISGRRPAAIAIVASALYGLSDEWHQSFVPGRDPSGLDVAVDTIGATVAVLTLHVAMPRLRHLGQRVTDSVFEAE